MHAVFMNDGSPFERRVVSQASLIAVVDDDADVRRALERLLRASRYAVATYASGADLLQSLQHSGPACILLDLRMPQLDGFAVLEALARERYNIPVIVLTAEVTPHAAARALALGAAQCLSKPLDDGVLLGALAACGVLGERLTSLD